MRRIIAPIAVVAVLGIIFACASDIILEEPPSLKGVYEGRYIVTTNFGSPTAVEQKQNIIWKFTDRDFFMYVDTPNVIQDICFCRAMGTYALEEKVRLLETSRVGIPDFPCDACDVALSPDGNFVLELPQDSVKLTHQNLDTLKEILLVRVPAE